MMASPIDKIQTAIALVLEYPRRTILFALILPLVALPGLFNLTLRTDGNALVPVRAPEVLSDAAIREAFGVDDQIAVVVQTQHEDGIYNTDTLDLVRLLSQKFAQIDGIQSGDIISLATEKGAHTEPGTYNFLPYLEPFPRTTARLTWLEKRLGELPIYTGALVAFDESATAILVDVAASDASTSSRVDRSLLVKDIKNTIASLGETSDKIIVTGASVAETLLGRHVLDGLVTMLPLAIALMMLILFVSGRSFWAVFLPMQEVAAVLVFTFGLMGWLGVPIYLTTGILPVILTAIGIADEIHIFSRYRQLLATGEKNQSAALLTTIREMAPPVIKTSITTSIGFLSFAFSSIQPVQMFGLFMAVGVLFCMVWSLTVIPAALMLINPKHFRVRVDGGDNTRFQIGDRFANCTIRYRRPILLIVMVLVFLSPLGLNKLFIQDSWLDGFSEQSDFRQGTQSVNAQFNGIHLLRLCWDAAPVTIDGMLQRTSLEAHTALLPSDLVEEPRWLRHSILHLGTNSSKGFEIVAAKRQGDAIRVQTAPGDGSMLAAIQAHADGEKIDFKVKPAADRLLASQEIERIKKFAEFLKLRDYVGGVTSTWDYIAAANFIGTGHRSGMYTVADSKYKSPARALGLMDSILGPERRDEVMNRDNNRALFTVYLKSANFIETRHLIQAIRIYEKNFITPQGIRLRLAGDVAVSQAMIPVLVETQVLSLVLSLLGVWLMGFLLHGSFLLSLLLVVPTGLAVCLLYAFMGFTGMPLGVATS
ncbi:MAG: MMPL family transporter, partial [Myxococcota bacterium]|nr:MMPL family transporter [Myxococcota bacterium]